jgi:hypothetical protein
MVENNSGGDDYPIPGYDAAYDRTSPWKAKYIYYSRYGLDSSGKAYSQTGTLRFSIDIADVDEFLRLASQGQPKLASTVVTAGGRAPTSSTPLDILAAYPSWVVIALDEPTKWRFNTNGPGLSCKKPYRSDKNQDLFHVDPITWERAAASDPYPDGCYLICFRLISRNYQKDPDGYVWGEAEQFNLNV